MARTRVRSCVGGLLSRAVDVLGDGKINGAAGLGKGLQAADDMRPAKSDQFCRLAACRESIVYDG